MVLWGVPLQPPRKNNILPESMEPAPDSRQLSAPGVGGAFHPPEKISRLKIEQICYE
jgi:hypothetical protein